MNDILRERMLRKLETLSEERAYQVLDYIEFLESKYAERPARSVSSSVSATFWNGGAPAGRSAYFDSRNSM